MKAALTDVAKAGTWVVLKVAMLVVLKVELTVALLVASRVVMKDMPMVGSMVVQLVA